MNMKRITLASAALLAFLAGGTALAQRSPDGRSGYTYVRDMSGEVEVVSKFNGRVQARRNMPISVGDEITAADGARAEIGLADGNVLHVGGGTTARFESLSDQQGEDDEFSAIHLEDGSLILTAAGSNENQIPRIDTQDATVYLAAGSRVRVNSDSRRGTVVIGRSGSAEVRSRAGTVTVRAGEYLMIRGDEEPELARGAFSRDRFDVWAADRTETLYETRSASARYVDEDYASDVVALDGYGDWNYSSEYSANVWMPRVNAGWTPYSYGSWYYTPVGLTWWSNDPWGWYPFHYGNWFFDNSFSRWCWSPASVYSPAWVYWAYTPSYTGWCPIGNYSFYSPWSDNYYRRWGWANRSNIYLSINGTFSTRRVDFHGWNFAGNDRFGAVNARMDVIEGSRIADRLGSQVAISSRPMVVNARGGGNVRDAIQNHLREAPRVIERAGTGDSSQDALRDRSVVADRGRLTGRAAGELAPRGAVVDRSHGPADVLAREPVLRDRGRQAPGRDATPESFGRSRPESVQRSPRAEADRAAPRGAGDEGWRGRSGSDGGRSERGRSEGGPSVAPAPRSAEPPHSESWRMRSDVPPARRVIERSVPGRQAPESRVEDVPRERGIARERDWRARAPDYAPPAREREFRSAPPREPQPRAERAPAYAPPPRVERAPAYSQPPSEREFRPVPQPRAERAPAYSQPPREREFRSAPPRDPQPRVERAPAYAPPPRPEHAPSYSAPPPAPRAEGRREAPPPAHHERGRKDN